MEIDKKNGEVCFNEENHIHTGMRMTMVSIFL